MRISHTALAGLVILAASGSAHATVLTLSVDPAGGVGVFTTLGAAVAFANLDANPGNTYDIQLVPGTYLNDFAPAITRPMTIEGVGGADQTVLQASVPLPNQKGILLTFASLTVKGLTFVGAAISNALGGNGAGIRDEIGVGGSDPTGTLTVQDSVFKDNQEGILTGGSGDREHVVIKDSMFLDNGNPNQAVFQHGLYVNDAATVDVSDSLFCGQLIGHNIKSRSLVTTITNVQSYEGTLGPGCARAGTASRGIDVPNGGVLTMTNIDMFQGSLSQNSAMFAYGEEGLKYAANSAALTDVSFTSTSGGTGIQWFGGANPCTLTNVTFSGLVHDQSPSGCTVSGDGGSGGGDGGGGTPVPEPGTLALLLGSLGALGFAGGLRQR